MHLFPELTNSNILKLRSFYTGIDDDDDSMNEAMNSEC
jgi:hypothetical protein